MIGEEESNIERKQKGESLSGGESSAEYIISKSEKESQLSDNTKKISPTTDTKNPTIESSNVERKERGESLPGGESSAEYMASKAGEESTKSNETEKTTESMGDKIMAGAKALKKKANDPDKNLRTEYDKEKLKE
jgi:hypothetical protein